MTFRVARKSSTAKNLGEAFIYRLYTTFAYLVSGCKEPHS